MRRRSRCGPSEATKCRPSAATAIDGKAARPDRAASISRVTTSATGFAFVRNEYELRRIALPVVIDQHRIAIDDAHWMPREPMYVSDCVSSEYPMIVSRKRIVDRISLTVRPSEVPHDEGILVCLLESASL